jgi:hypothetical protein
MPVFPIEEEEVGAPGSEIVASYQYEFRGFLFGSGTPYIVSQAQGILSMPSTTDHDSDKEYEHGVHPGTLTMGKRIIAFDLSIAGAAGVDIETKQAELNRIFQTPRLRQSRITEPLVFWRPGQVKKAAYVRCTKREFSSTYKTARGLSVGSVELQAPDPRLYGLDTITATKALGIGETTGDVSASGFGDFVDGTLPVIEITGPATNPTIANIDDDSRTFKLAVILTAADAVRVDFQSQRIWKRTGIGQPWVEDFTIFDNTSKWWAVLPGENTIRCTRAAGNTAASATYSITSRDVWQ